MFNKMLDEMNEVKSDLAQLIRLAVAEQTEDVRLFVARLVRKYRNTDPEQNTTQPQIVINWN